MNHSQALLGKYRLKDELGRGGMAVVYRAHDPTLDREVAIKVLSARLAGPDWRARFEREATLIASLEHAAIVPVYDYGEAEGQPYLVMRLMRGGSLADRLHHYGPFSLEDAVNVVDRLAPAIDMAHSRGIIHRDLKAGNILFDEEGKPYIADFGLARLMQYSGISVGHSGVLGTPAYMSPEQVRGDVELDGRTDVYALGVVLFEMLAGRQPYEADTPMALAMQHLNAPTPSIRTHRRDLPEDVAAIVTRALAKDRNKRFRAAGELATALRTAVAEPQRSSTGSALQWPLFIGVVVAVVLFIFTMQIDTAVDNNTSSNGTGSRQTVVTATPVPATPTVALNALVPVSPQNAGTLQPIRRIEGEKHIEAVAFSPNGIQLAYGADDNSVHVWHLADMRSLHILTGHTDWVLDVTYSADGTLLASTSADGTVRVWRAADGRLLTTIHSPAGGVVWDVVFSPDGTMLVSGEDDGTARVWGVPDGTLLRTLDGDTGRVTAVAYNPDSTMVATGGADAAIRLWQMPTGTLLHTLTGHQEEVLDVAFSPDGTGLASTSQDGTVRLWNIRSGITAHIMSGHTDWVVTADFSPSGDVLATGSADSTIRLWNTTNGNSLGVLRHHTNRVLGVDFNRSGTLLGSGAEDNFVIVWGVPE